MSSNSWKEAQTGVAEFLLKYNFSVQEEFRLKSGKRIDIVAQKKLPQYLLHVLIEVKDWNTVSRRKEMDFCNQIIDYLIEYSVTDVLQKNINDTWHRTKRKITDRFIGILCLTKDSHFSYRKVSNHFLEKHRHIQGIPLREQIIQQADLYVSRFATIQKVFDELNIPLFKEPSLEEWL